MDKEISGFQTVMERIYAATGTSTQQELALLLGIRQSSISDAKRRAIIPFRWLLTLSRLRSVNPDWVLTGKAPMYLGTGAEKAGTPC